MLRVAPKDRVSEWKGRPMIVSDRLAMGSRSSVAEPGTSADRVPVEP